MPTALIFLIQQKNRPQGPKYVGATGGSKDDCFYKYRCDLKEDSKNLLQRYMWEHRADADQFEIIELETMTGTPQEILVRTQDFIEEYNTVKPNGLNGKNATRACRHKPDRRKCDACKGSNSCPCGQKYQCPMHNPCTYCPAPPNNHGWEHPANTRDHCATDKHIEYFNTAMELLKPQPLPAVSILVDEAAL